MEEPVFERIRSLEERKQELENLSRTPAELEPINKTELEELRRMTRPPRTVCDCLEVVYITLHVEKCCPEIRRLPADGRMSIDWKKVQAMLARFDTFFPKMQHYDIGALTAMPEVLRYLARAYFGERGLSEPRVQRSSKACLALFRWYANSAARVEAALELAAVTLELATLELPASGTRWICRADRGWVEFPCDVDAQLTAAEATGGLVSFELGDERYEVDVAGRVQRNFATEKLRPIRPPGTEIGLRGMQGAWLASWGGRILVRGCEVTVNGCSEHIDPLQELEGGGIAWTFLLGRWQVSGGTPCCVQWENAHGSKVIWDAVAGS